tara:strand:- start:598 stop:948 length:351 start_codon:yes stop_codon:yes gene_type:complete
LILDELRQQLATQLLTILNNGKIGLGGNSTSPASLTLDVPLNNSTTTFTVIKSNDNIIEVLAKFDGSLLTGEVVRELGIFDNSSPTNKMLSRVNFNGVGPFASTDSVEFFLTIEVE